MHLAENVNSLKNVFINKIKNLENCDDFGKNFYKRTPANIIARTKTLIYLYKQDEDERKTKIPRFSEILEKIKILDFDDETLMKKFLIKIF